LEPLLGAAVALVCLTGRRSASGRVVSAGIQLAIGIQLTLFFLGYVGYVGGASSGDSKTPQPGAYLGFVGGIMLALGGYLASQEQAVADAPPARAKATP
jgi:hypothetical protein